MSRSYGRKPRSTGYSRAKAPPGDALRDTTVKLFDLGDGHGTDWAAASEALFRCAFDFLRHVPPGDPRGVTIARRVLDAATNLVAGSEDTGAAYTAPGAKPDRPVFSMHIPAPGHDPHQPGR